MLIKTDKLRFTHLSPVLILSSAISLLTILLPTIAIAADDAEFDYLGDLPGGANYSVPESISSDGSVAVGYSASGTGTEAFRWNVDDGMVGLGYLAGGSTSYAMDVSSDGAVIVGLSRSTAGTEAFRWTQATGMVSLGDLSGGSVYSRAHGVSSDGNTIVGWSRSSSGTEAFRWNSNVMQGLGDLAGGGFSSNADGVSADGSVITGYGTSGSGIEAFRWTQAGGMVGLGMLGATSTDSRGVDISADGNVIVGYDRSSGNIEQAFRWTQATGMLGLGDLAGGDFKSRAKSISADGLVVVGFGNSASGIEAFRWSEASGMQSVAQWLTDNGLASVGTTLRDALGTNEDGSVVVGYDANNLAFIARVAQTAGVINPSSFNQTLSEISANSVQHNSLQSHVLNNLHTAPLQSRARAGQNMLLLSGGIGRANSAGSDAGQASSEIGVDWGLSDQLNVRLFVGATASELKTLHGGSNKKQGFYMHPQVIAPLGDKGLFVSFSGFYSKSDVDIDRHYLNGGTLDSSVGNTSIETIGSKLRFDWQNAFALKKLAVTPYTSVSTVQSRTAGYSEREGSFPVNWHSVSDVDTITSVGFDASYNHSAITRVQFTLEGSHRLTDTSSQVNGQIIGLNDFSFKGSELEQNWLRAGVGIDYQLKKGSIGAMLNVTTEQEGINNWLNLRYSLGF
ncbi:autotransporter domain-containing protein [Gammaproteobacteria bacterium AS21]